MGDVFLIQNETLKAIADAIRGKTGENSNLTPAQMAEAVFSLQLGIDTSDATAIAEDILYGKTAYADGIKLYGTLQKGIDTNDATAEAAQILAGYTAYAKGIKVTGSMVNRGAVSAKPKANSSYTIPAGYHNGNGKVTPDTSDATATAAQIVGGYTAYSGGAKVTGTMPVQAAKTITPSSSEQTAVEAGKYTTGAVTVAAVPTEEKIVTPTANAQTVTPSDGKFLSKVMVNGYSFAGFSKVVTGTVKTTDNTKLTWTHNMGSVPDGFLIFTDAGAIGTATKIVKAICGFKHTKFDLPYIAAYVNESSAYFPTGAGEVDGGISKTTTQIVIDITNLYAGSNEFRCDTTSTYYCVAVKL